MRQKRNLRKMGPIAHFHSFPASCNRDSDLKCYLILRYFLFLLWKLTLTGQHNEGQKRKAEEKLRKVILKLKLWDRIDNYKLPVRSTQCQSQKIVHHFLSDLMTVWLGNKKFSLMLNTFCLLVTVVHRFLEAGGEI